MSITVTGATSTAYAKITSTSSSSQTASTTRTGSSNTVSASTTVSKSSSTTTVSKSSSTTAAVTNSSKTSGTASTTTKVNTSSASTTATVRTNSSLTSTSSYPYIRHMGKAGTEQMEAMLIKLGYDDVVDQNYDDALKNFDSVYHINDSIYGSKMVEKIQEISNIHDRIGMELSELGFYNKQGKDQVNPYSVEADSVSRDIFNALDNFCSLYGMDREQDGLDAVIEKVKSVHDTYKKILNSDKLNNIASKLWFDKTNNIQKENFSKSWTFLKMGRGFSDELAAGVMANWYAEGEFSETNAQNNRYEGINNSDYKFEVDKVGWGIMQWSEERKQDLLDTAEEMGTGVGNINTQFALFIKEITTGGEKNHWANVTKEDCNAKEYAIKFMEEIERCGDDSENNLNKRKTSAQTIYDEMKGLV